MSLEDASLIAGLISLVIGIVYGIAKGIYYLGHSKKMKRFNKGRKKIKKFLRPYINNRFVFRSLLFLDYVVFALVTVLCFIYLDLITISHNVYLASFVALALMAANINLLYRAALVYSSFRRSLA